MRRLVLLALCAAATACEIPIRDNPIDPENRPRAVVRAFVEIGEDEFVESGEGRRNARFRFDASESTDSDGRTMSFKWDFDGDLDFDDGVDEFPSLVLSSDGALATLSLQVAPEEFNPITSKAFRTISVRVRAGSGRGVGSSSIGITNDSPLPNPGEDLYVPSGIGQMVTLDPCGGSSPCLTVDPDGDVLLWDDETWDQVAGTSSPLTFVGTAGLATFSAPIAPGVLAFSLTANDGVSTATARQVVRVGQQVWARTDERFYRLNVEQRANNVISIATSGSTSSPSIRRRVRCGSPATARSEAERTSAVSRRTA